MKATAKTGEQLVLECNLQEYVTSQRQIAGKRSIRWCACNRPPQRSREGLERTVGGKHLRRVSNRSCELGQEERQVHHSDGGRSVEDEREGEILTASFLGRKLGGDY
ncbi:hypothetical protein CDL15_Pgr012679 [Punica granatum]|uniref:Uncharacterized protein n=1 Tax=Punica granatum TaxID=22663 RepID=A0A218XU92_PUNGR|nr:hypothetical protein CDL15_Pgr012679 [Punica granatum]